MKLFRDLGLLLFVCAFSYSNMALANSTGKTTHFKDLKKVSLKCYVEFIGGKNAILYHYDLPKNDRTSFENWLLESYTDVPGINKSKKIYKVNECVEIKNKFKDRIAISLEEKLKEAG